MPQFSRQVKRAITGLGVSVAVFRIACVAGVRKGRGRGRELGRETSRAPLVSLAPKTPFPKTPFPFPFKRLPRRLCLELPKRCNPQTLLT